MPPSQPDLELARQDYRRLLNSAQTLIFGTVSSEGVPSSGMAPFVHSGGSFHVFVSRLAAHTGQLLELDRTQVMILEDESAARQVFARKRASFTCTVTTVSPQVAVYDSVLDEMEDRFGSVMGVLRSLPDFVLFRLTPDSGRFVSGFAQAYDVSGPELDVLTPVGPNQASGPA